MYIEAPDKENPLKNDTAKYPIHIQSYLIVLQHTQFIFNRITNSRQKSTVYYNIKHG